jgi:putative ABC transport system substrate-binding protein
MKAIRRRDLITGIVISATAWPLAARAQQPAKVARIGFLGNSTAALEANLVGPFRAGLRELGYEEGRDIVIEYRWADGRHERFPALIAELIALKVDAIVTAGTPASLAVSTNSRYACTPGKFPGIYSVPDFPQASGLLSYGVSLADAYRQAGVLTGRVLKGAKPAELPVMQPTKFEFVLNLKTAKALGLEVPPTLLARADEVIE